MSDSAHRFDDGAAYERLMRPWSRAAGAAFLAWLAAPPAARWLDVGCGTGVFTELMLETCAPVEVVAVDSAPAQIEHARCQPVAQRASFRLADARALPFPDSAFDVVTSALVINFVPDQVRALREMRRVAKPHGPVAGYVWDFAAELSPTWPLRVGLRQIGVDDPPVPGTQHSSLAALFSLFERAGLEEIAVTSIEVTAPFRDFGEFWAAQTASHSPIGKAVAGLTRADRAKLVDAVCARVPASQDGRITYSARANAIKARVPA